MKAAENATKPDREQTEPERALRLSREALRQDPPVVRFLREAPGGLVRRTDDRCLIVL